MTGRREFFAKLALFSGFAALAAPTPAKAQAPSKRFIKREASERSGYSQAVITQGRATGVLAAATGGPIPSNRRRRFRRARVRGPSRFIERTARRTQGFGPRHHDRFLTDATITRVTALRRNFGRTHQRVDLDLASGQSECADRDSGGRGRQLA